MNEQLVNDLKASKAELEKRGWSKGTLIHYDGAVCMLGAVGCALVEDYEKFASYQPFRTNGRVVRAVQALAAQLPPRVAMDEVDLIFYNNDHPDTTLEDVYNFFDKALAEAGGLG